MEKDDKKICTNNKVYPKEVEELVDNMSLMDDELMARVFNENIPATELLISTILSRDVVIVSTKGQFDMKNPIVGGRNIRLDILAKEEQGNYFNCEVQRSDDGATPTRARFHSAMLDSRMLEAGQKFSEIKDSYVIFITEKDYYNSGKAFYLVERVVDNDKAFQDGNHIIYVNASYEGNDNLGRLLQDMRNRTKEGFNYKELEESVRHFKDTSEGREIMSEAVERYAKKYAEKYSEGQYEKGIIDSIKNLMKNLKMTAEQAMDAIGVPQSDRKKYMTML